MKKTLIYTLLLFAIGFFSACNSEPEVIRTISCNSEMLSSDHSFFLCNEDSSATFYNPGKNGESNEVARSGKFSLKLEGPKVFGYTYDLNDAKPGQFYRVSVWKQGASKQSFLVVDCNRGTKKLLYIKLGKSKQTVDGWDYIENSFEIPNTIANNESIKIYIWNPGKEKVFFDDIKIEQISKLPNKIK